MVLPLTETCAAGVAGVGWAPAVGSGGAGLAEGWPPAVGTASLWEPAEGEPWAWGTRAAECWDWCMTTGELCTWWTVIDEKGMTSDLTDDTWDSDGTAGRFCCACPCVGLCSSWFFRLSAAVGFSMAEYCTAWDGSTPLSSPSVTCLPSQMEHNSTWSAHRPVRSNMQQSTHAKKKHQSQTNQNSGFLFP